MTEGNKAPVIAGLVIGVLLILIMAFGLNPNLLALNDYREDDQRRIDRMAQHETVQLFLKKYPYSQPTLGISSDTGLPYWLSYQASAKTVFDYNAPTLMSERKISLLVQADDNADVKEVMLFCGNVSNIPIVNANVTGEDKVLRWLEKDLC